MIEITGNLWDRYNKMFTICLITTNGSTRRDGRAVMGRGCALEAKRKFPGLDKELGKLIVLGGNKVHSLRSGLWTFPVKHEWWEKASLGLIFESAQRLKWAAEETSSRDFILPKPGCGNGGLKWEDVRPLLHSLPNNVKVISPE